MKEVKVYCIDEESDGLWKIYGQSSAIPHGTFNNANDAINHIEKHMEIEKQNYQVNPMPLWLNEFSTFHQLVYLTKME